MDFKNRRTVERFAAVLWQLGQYTPKVYSLERCRDLGKTAGGIYRRY